MAGIHGEDDIVSSHSNHRKLKEIISKFKIALSLVLRSNYDIINNLGTTSNLEWHIINDILQPLEIEGSHYYFYKIREHLATSLAMAGNIRNFRKNKQVRSANAPTMLLHGNLFV